MIFGFQGSGCKPRRSKGADPWARHAWFLAAPDDLLLLIPFQYQKGKASRATSAPRQALFFIIGRPLRTMRGVVPDEHGVITVEIDPPPSPQSASAHQKSSVVTPSRLRLGLIARSRCRGSDFLGHYQVTETNRPDCGLEPLEWYQGQRAGESAATQLGWQHVKGGTAQASPYGVPGTPTYATCYFRLLARPARLASAGAMV